MRRLTDISVRLRSAVQVDPGSGEFADAVLLKAFGEVSSDLSTL
jgi:hypothetical protein